MIELIGPDQRDRVFPGAVVILKGIVRGKVIPGLVTKIHPPDVLVTDAIGDERPWNGRLPVIDVVAVDAKLIDSAFSNASVSTTEGEVIMITKIASDGDVRRNARNNIRPIPMAIVESSPRYLPIGKLEEI